MQRLSSSRRVSLPARLSFSRRIFTVIFLLACFGFLRTIAHAHEGYRIAYGKVSAHPGQIVEVPIFADAAKSVDAFTLGMAFDPTRLEFVKVVIEGTEAARINPASAWGDVGNPGELMFGVIAGLNSPGGKNILLLKLNFRILADAAEGATSLVPQDFTAGQIGFSFSGESGTRQTETEESGEATVLAPLGPRPPGAVSCAQFLDRVELLWNLTETYDGLDLHRNGMLIASLSGSETSLVDLLAGRVGRQLYELTAHRAGKSSVTIGCEVSTTAPAAPKPEEMSCQSGTLNWTNPVEYNHMTVFRDGTVITVLPGNVSSFVDPAPTNDESIYSLEARLEGFASPQIHCIVNGTWRVVIPDVVVPVDAKRVSVPIHATIPTFVDGLQIFLNDTPKDLAFVSDRVEILRDTVSDQNPDLILAGTKGANGHPALGILYEVAPPDEGKGLTPSLDSKIANLVWDVTGNFSEGDRVPIRLSRNPRWQIALGRMEVTFHPEVLVDGHIHFGSNGVAIVKNLSSKVNGTSSSSKGLDSDAHIALSWKNSGKYDEIRIERDGALVKEISGNSQSYIDPGLDRGTYSYRVTGIRDGLESPGNTLMVTTLTPPGIFVRGDATVDRRIDITDVLATLKYILLSEHLSCEDAADSNDDGAVDLTDAWTTLGYLFLGFNLPAPHTSQPWIDKTDDNLKCDS